ncbi:hypothetical protein [uncultured Polaribacter sp.]|uniref:hypothetical protein n=1 Tax=uncultured Polaribacter sp. TaxID=174711 RepID=UPI0030D99576
MKTRYVIFVLSLSLLMACGWEKSASISIEELQKNQQTVKKVTTNLVLYKDSIININTKLSNLRATKDSINRKLGKIHKEKDSISIVLSQVEKSTEQLITKKIVPAIDSIKIKLLALSEPKEAAVTKLELQEQEILVAEKKITLFTEEKTVYDAQLKALRNKGAAPEDYISIKKTIEEIKRHIKAQTLKATVLKKSMIDLKEQTVSIDEEIDSLSTKISANYSAREIVNEYLKEEQLRLFNDLKSIDLNIESTNTKNDSIQHKIDFYTSNNSNFEAKVSNEEKLKAFGNKVQNSVNPETASAKIALKTVDKEKMKNAAFIAIGFIAAILFVFYILGKKRKSKKKLKLLAKLEKR